MNVLKSAYRWVKRLLRAAGYELVVVKRSASTTDHELSIPNATYAPWISDRAFNETYSVIREHTLVDIYRCYELWQLVSETVRLKGALVEVGVWRGGSGALIAQKARLEGIPDPVYLCDTFRGVVKSGEHDTSYTGGEHRDVSRETVERLLEKLGTENAVILPGIFPEDTAGNIREEHVRFCHIDVDVYRSAKDVVDWLWPRLVVGGIIVFDDYGFSSCDGIRIYVNEQRNTDGRVVIHNLNGHAVIVKTSG